MPGPEPVAVLRERQVSGAPLRLLRTLSACFCWKSAPRWCAHRICAVALMWSPTRSILVNGNVDPFEDHVSGRLERSERDPRRRSS